MRSEIDAIIELHQHKFDLLKKIEAPKIGWVSICTPEEIIHAAGAVPFRITGENTDVVMAKSCMYSNLCSYVLSSFEELYAHADNFCDGAVIVNICDARQKLYEAYTHFMRKDFVFLLEFPNINGSDARAWFKHQIERMIAWIEQRFNCRIDENALKNAILMCNETRALLAALFDYRKKNNPPITGTASISIVKAAMSGLKQDFNDRLAKLIPKIDTLPVSGEPEKPRVLICGSYFDHTNITQFIEAIGADIVCEDMSTGVKYFEGQVDIDADPLEAMADYYLEKATCAAMFNPEKRFRHMRDLIQAYKVSCVIYFTLKFCDPNLLDFPYQKEKLKEIGIPVLPIEIERSMQNIEQIKTRVQAFLETTPLPTY